MRAFRHGWSWVRVDPRGQIVRAELDDAAGWRERPPTPAHDGKGIVLLDAGHRWQAPLHASVAASGALAGFVPAFALIAKAKRFDDRFIAAMDRLAHRGLGPHIGWTALLATLRPRLAGNARALVDAARSFVGDEVAADGAERLAMRKWVRDFERDPMRSRPIGFYAESDDLARLFKHDRLLQTELAPHDADAIAGALGAERDSYGALLALAETVTGPRAIGSVEDRTADKRALLPASDSIEGRMIKELFSSRPVPDGFRVVEELVARIRDGRIDTTPRPGDGWYAYKQHAIAALLRPETPGLEIGPKYRRELEETFAALFALNRESHAKQLEIPAAAGKPPLTIAPEFSVEPLPELYARIAAAYRFVREALSALVGEDGLRSVELDGLDAFDALVDIEALFLGAEATARAELGQPTIDVTSRARFATFARDAIGDPDLAYDLRVAVPLYKDLGRERVRIVATVGLETRTLLFDWVIRPDVQVLGAHDEPRFTDSKVSILSPITIECDVRVPPTRDELREICEREGQPEAIREALIAR